MSTIGATQYLIKNSRKYIWPRMKILIGHLKKDKKFIKVFSQRYCQCNLKSARSEETNFLLAYAIILLNTDLHTPKLKPNHCMSLDDFIKNLSGTKVDRHVLVDIYERLCF